MMNKALILLAMLAAAAAPDTSFAACSDARPNVVLIMTDDQGYGDLSCHGNPVLKTPNLDQLYHESVRLTDYHVAPTCTPTRAALMTGHWPNRTGAWHTTFGRSLLREDAVTLGQVFQQAGYATGMFGKWHLGDAPHALPTRHGFDEWIGVPYSNDMNWVDEPDFAELVKLSMRGNTAEQAAVYARRGAKYADPKAEHFAAPLMFSRATNNGFVDRVEQPTDQTLLTQRATEAAVDFIQRSADEPFFLYMPYSMPHTPLFRSDAFAGRSLGGRYGDVVEEIDASVGAIHDAIEAAGVLENTLIIFTSDNGPWLFMREEGGVSGLLRDGKGTTFEGGVRVPTVFYWPGTVVPEVVSDIGSAMDLFPTVMALVGGDATSATDALDLSPRLLGEDASPRNEMPYYRGGSLYAYRKGPWKLHFITEGAYGLPPAKQQHETPKLYHLQRDPAERFDVAAQNPRVVADLQAAVVAHQAAVTVAPPLFDARLAAIAAQLQRQAANPTASDNDQ